MRSLYVSHNTCGYKGDASVCEMDECIVTFVFRATQKHTLSHVLQNLVPGEKK